MAKKQAQKDAKEAAPAKVPAGKPLSDDQLSLIQQRLPKELQERFTKLKPQVETFKKKLLEKFSEYVIGIGLLPPEPKKDAQGNPTKEFELDKINVLVLIDDSDSMKMSKEELAHKLSSVIDSIAAEVDKNLLPETVILSELWQSCYDCKDDLLQMIALTAPVFDKGLLTAVKVTEVHKQMVLKKFERYIVAYVLAGPATRGDVEAESPIDLFIVIDDTDVKKMTRVELRDKLRAIIQGMSIEAGELTGIKNRFNIQVFILTDFWDSLKEANPLTFNLLRDGIPFFDRGIFMPWKQLLRMGKIKPSSEAIEVYMSTGDQALKRVRYKMREVGQDDIYYALLTPSQAALMLYGIPPPAPAETPKLLREVFVKKEKVLDDKFVKILEKVISLRKDLMTGKKKDFTGTESDALVKEAETYLKEIGELFSRLESTKEQESILQTYDTVIGVTRDLLRTEDVDNVDDAEIVAVVESTLVQSNKISEGFLRTLKAVRKAKEDFESDKLTKDDIDKVRKESRNYIKQAVEYMQRKRGREMERAKLRIKYHDKVGEVIMLDTTAYIIDDVSSDKPGIHKSPITKEGGLAKIEPSSFEEIEKALDATQIPPKVFLREPIFEDLKKVFGHDVEILVK